MATATLDKPARSKAGRKPATKPVKATTGPAELKLRPTDARTVAPSGVAVVVRAVALVNNESDLEQIVRAVGVRRVELTEAKGK